MKTTCRLGFCLVSSFNGVKAIRASSASTQGVLKLPVDLSMLPLASRWYAMVMACRTPSLEQEEDQAKEENWLPLSEVTVSGTQKRVTQLDMNALYRSPRRSP
jgi:hypothetical protein